MTIRITRESLLDGSVLERVRTHADSIPDMRYRTDAEMAALLRVALSQHDLTQDLYVFGYASLIWNPAFQYVSRHPATLHGWHRRFCLRLLAGRGSPETPGLALALDHGGSCKGMAFRIAAAQVPDELGILWRREMYGGSYNSRWVRLNTPEGARRAITFVANRGHPRYLPEIGDVEAARIIAGGRGDGGTCQEYLENTVAHLAALGIPDRGLARLVAALPKL